MRISGTCELLKVLLLIYIYILKKIFLKNIRTSLRFGSSTAYSSQPCWAERRGRAGERFSVNDAGLHLSLSNTGMKW